MKFTKILLLTALLGTTSLMAENTVTPSCCVEGCKTKNSECCKNAKTKKENTKKIAKGKFCTSKCECGGNKKK